MRSLSKILKPGMTGAFYGRVSTGKQDIDSQLKSVKRMVQKYGCEIVREYRDEGVSATKVKLQDREQLIQLYKDVVSEKYDFIAVYDDSRLARNPVEHFQIQSFFMDVAGVPIVLSSTEDLYHSSDLLSNAIRMGLSKLEADKTSEKTRDAFKKKIEHGETTGGPTPYGYVKQSDGRYLPDPSKKTIIEQISNAYKKGEGFKSIAKKINEKYKTKFTKDKVKAIITNPFYAGYVTMGRYSKNAKNTINDRDNWIITQSSNIEPIISKTEWDYCWTIYEERRKGSIPPKHFKTSFYLKDIVYCKNCDVPLQCKNQMTKGRGKKYGKQKYICPKCELFVDRKKLHDEVIIKVVNAVLVKDFHTEPKRMHKEVLQSFKNDVDKLKTDIKALESKLAGLSKELNRTENEIRSKLKEKKTDTNKKILQILSKYRISINNEIEFVKNMITQKQQNISYIERVESNYKIWRDLYIDLIGESDDDIKSDTDIRRLVLYLLKKVEIDHTGQIYITARADLDVEHHLDIEIID